VVKGEKGPGFFSAGRGRIGKNAPPSSFPCPWRRPSLFPPLLRPGSRVLRSASLQNTSCPLFFFSFLGAFNEEIQPSPSSFKEFTDIKLPVPERELDRFLFPCEFRLKEEVPPWWTGCGSAFSSGASTTTDDLLCFPESRFWGFFPLPSQA